MEKKGGYKLKSMNFVFEKLFHARRMRKQTTVRRKQNFKTGREDLRNRAAPGVRGPKD